MGNVGKYIKYTSPMDAMGSILYILFQNKLSI